MRIVFLGWFAQAASPKGQRSSGMLLDTFELFARCTPPKTVYIVSCIRDASFVRGRMRRDEIALNRHVGFQQPLWDGRGAPSGNTKSLVVCWQLDCACNGCASRAAVGTRFAWRPVDVPPSFHRESIGGAAARGAAMSHARKIA